MSKTVWTTIVNTHPTASTSYGTETTRICVRSELPEHDFCDKVDHAVLAHSTPDIVCRRTLPGMHQTFTILPSHTNAKSREKQWRASSTLFTKYPQAFYKYQRMSEDAVPCTPEVIPDNVPLWRYYRRQDTGTPKSSCGGLPESSVLEQPVNYDQQMYKYDWRMEVHGDPFNKKGPCLPPRLSFSVPATEENIVYVKLPTMEQPLQFPECYFQDTRPFRSKSFIIHPHLLTEKLQHPSKLGPCENALYGGQRRYAQQTILY